MREKLAHVESIKNIEPIAGADNIVLATILGWEVIVKKDEFKVGDLAIYIEIDSVVDISRPEFAFLEKRGCKIKTMKMRGVYSQGLILPLNSYGKNYKKLKEGDDVTKHFNIIHTEEYEQQLALKKEKNKYKGFKKFLYTHKHLRWVGVLLKYWKKEPVKIKRPWPGEIEKTDETRIQNLPWYIEEIPTYCKEHNCKLIATEKVDGCSSTFLLRVSKHKKYTSVYKGFDYIVCSRNQVIDSQSDQIWAVMSRKYNMEKVLYNIFREQDCRTFVAIQGETIDIRIQGNKYGLKGPEDASLYVFNLIIDGKRIGTLEMKKIVDAQGLTTVPIISEDYQLENSVDKVLLAADGDSVLIPKEFRGSHLREGIVFRTSDGQKSFKAVSNKFLIKHKE